MQFEEENGTILKLEDINNIDTLFLGSHKMIPYAGRFLEMTRTTSDYTLLVDHKRRLINKGKKGAMGTTTQGSVENVDLSGYKLAHSEKKLQDISVYATKEDPSYILVLGGKTKKFRDSKSFLKLVSSDKKDEIEKYIKEQKISFKDIESVISLVNYSIQ